jgi:hypothetical protein
MQANENDSSFFSPGIRHRTRILIPRSPIANVISSPAIVDAVAPIVTFPVALNCQARRRGRICIY